MNNVVLGLLVFLLGLWGGCWLMQCFPIASGYHGASCVTGFLVSLIGVVLIWFGLKQWMK